MIAAIAKHRAKEVDAINKARPVRKPASAGKGKSARRPGPKIRAKAVKRC